MEGVDEIYEIVDDVQAGNSTISGARWDSEIRKLVVELSPTSSPSGQRSAKAELRKKLGDAWKRVIFEVSNVSTAEAQRLAEAIWEQSVEEKELPQNCTVDALNDRTVVGTFYDDEREAIIVIRGRKGSDEEMRRILSRVPNPSGIKIIESPGEMQTHARTRDSGGGRLSDGSA